MKLFSLKSYFVKPMNKNLKYLKNLNGKEDE